MKAVVRVLDEINIQLFNVAASDIQVLIDLFKIFIPKARHTAAYKLKKWDGKEANITKDGKTYLYMLKRIMPVLEKMGYTLELEDFRTKMPTQPPFIDKNFLAEFDIELRDYQVGSVNAVIQHRMGFLDFATAAGKTIITAAIVRSYKDMKTVTIVPSEYLAKQTWTDVSRVVDNCHYITGKTSKKDRLKAWNADHLVITWQTLKNNKAKASRYNVLLYDEAHVIGDVMFDLMSNHMNNAFVRIGMTGTIIEEKFKYEKCACHFGGDVLKTKEAHELMKEGHISTVEVEMLALNHNIELPIDPTNRKIDWEDEEEYLNNNKKRLNTLHDVVDILHKNHVGNSLMLIHPQSGQKLAKLLGIDFIDKDTATSIREQLFEGYDDADDYLLGATFGTVGTGISINNIQYLYCIDLGENKTRIKQGIGRGLRKDGSLNHLKVFDIYSVLYYLENGKRRIYNFGGSKHVTGRKKIYKSLHYPFIELNSIEVK